MEFLPIRADHIEDLAAEHDTLKPRHHFEPEQLMAINAALSASRPLLVRGEPGIGKSQLARAAAKALGRAFIQHVVDARTESRDLLWHFDAVGRLAEAQVMGALQVACPPLQNNDPQDGDPAELALKLLRKRLDPQQFLHPRALWWAFDWENAAMQAGNVRGRPATASGRRRLRQRLCRTDRRNRQGRVRCPQWIIGSIGRRPLYPAGLQRPSGD